MPDASKASFQNIRVRSQKKFIDLDGASSRRCREGGGCLVASANPSEESLEFRHLLFKRREEGQGKRCVSPGGQQGSKEDHQISKSVFPGLLTFADLMWS